MKKNDLLKEGKIIFCPLKKTLITMKVIITLLVMNLLSLQAVTFPQSMRLNVNLENAPMKTLFSTIEEQTNYRFVYNEKTVENKFVTINLKNATIDNILDAVLANTGNSYKLLDNNLIVIAPENVIKAQQIKITGKVVDANGNPLPGVNIIEKGTNNGTVTDADGKYTIAVTDVNAVLVFSFVGYLKEEIPVAGKNEINVTMIEDIQKLDEIVVVGYGVMKKSDVTGAIVKVSEQVLKERPVQNALQAMQGKVPGADIITNIRPGEVPAIKIRGTRSINASNDPLYIVDGIILMGNLNDINPNDIESIEILKDASSTAIYGSRGANGVVLITTKKGIKGKFTVNYDATVSFDNLHSLTKWASAGEAIDRMRMAEINGGTYLKGSTKINYPDPFADIQKFGNNDPYTIEAIRKAYEWEDPGTFTQVKMRDATEEEKAKGYPDQVPIYNPQNIPTTDWIGLLTRTGITHNHVLSIGGGNEHSRVFLSFGYHNNKGAQLNQSYERYTFKLNGDITPTKWLNAGASILSSYQSQEYGTIYRSGSATGPKDLYGMALSQIILAKPYDENGKLIEYPGNNKSTPIWNPFIDVDNTLDLRRTANIQGNFYGEVSFTPWIKYKLNVGLGIRERRNGEWQGSQSTLNRKGNPPLASASFDTYQDLNYLIENLLFINKEIGVHSFGVTLLQSMQYDRRERIYTSASKILVDDFKFYNLAANLNGKPDNYLTNLREVKLMSYLGRLNYSLLNKYILTASLRFDGSSVLSKGNKWNSFPSFSFAWKIHEEEFLKKVNILNELKLRFGYGISGNAAIEPYTTSGPIVQYNYVFENTPATGFMPYYMPNPNLKWERTSQTNIGIDFGILKNRINGSFDYYYSFTRDILMERSLPPITGYPLIMDNIGKMKNIGFEIKISTINIKTKDFTWSSDISWSTNKEQIVELVNGKQDMPGNNWFIGYPLTVFRHYEVAGIWQATHEDSVEINKWNANGYKFAPGTYKPVDRDSDYRLTDADKVIRGSVNPKWVAGFTNNFKYKNWELNIYIYARVGQKYFSSLLPGGMSGGSFVGYMRSEDINNFWSIDNPDAKWPLLTSANVGNADVTRATYINDGSYAVVRNISLAYNVPQKVLNKAKINNLQVYGQVLNPFIFGGKVVKNGINPDDPNNWHVVNSVGDPVGGTNNNTIIVRSWVIGIKLGL